MITVDFDVLPVGGQSGYTTGSKGGPSFSTVIVRTDSGAEYSIQRWAQSRGKWNVAYDVQTLAQLLTLQEFYQARGGKARGFLFQDNRDYQSNGYEAIGTGDGIKTVFQLVRNYTSGGVTAVRNVTRPQTGTVVVQVAGVAVTPASISYTAGTVTLSSAPTLGQAVTASFKFYVPARFDSDVMDVTLDGIVGGWDEVNIVEILE